MTTTEALYTLSADIERLGNAGTDDDTFERERALLKDRLRVLIVDARAGSEPFIKQVVFNVANELQELYC